MNPEVLLVPGDANREVMALIKTLVETERRLQEITRGEVDTLMGSDGRPFLLGRAQEQLRRREADRQSAILNALPANIALLDAEGVIISVNEAWRCFADGNGLHAPGHAVGLNYVHICENGCGNYSLESKHVAAGIRAVLGGNEKSYGMEYPCHAPANQRWLQLTVTPLAEDCANGVVVMHTNVTERRVAEDRLRASEQAIRESEVRYRRLFETAQDAILILDAETGLVVDANPFMKQLLGYSQEEFLGRKLWEIVPFKGEAASKIAFAELQHKDKLRYESLPLETKEGNRVEVEFISSAYASEHRRFIQCNIRDITGLKRAEAERERVFTLSLDLLCIVGFDGNFQRLNPAFEKTLGFTETEVRGKPLIEFVHPDDCAATLAEVGRLAGGAVTLNFENRYRCKDGSYRLLSWTAAPFSKESTIYGVGRDITERRKLEEQLRQSQKMEAIGQLASGVAHDFNNILAVILMQASTLGDADDLSTEQQGRTKDIVMSVQRAAALTRQLLLFSRKEIMRQTDLDLSQSINGMTQMLRRVLGEHIQMQFKFSMQPLLIHADAGMMDQVLMNLAVNSRDAMPDGGQLVIETSVVEFDEMAAVNTAQARQGSFVCLSVSDTGCGIAPENLSRVFEPFFTTKEVGKGTGLGLATVFGIVQQHQGWINVYSEGGHGTTFRIYVPRLEKISEQKSEPPVPEAVRGGDETILLSEDDPFLRDSISEALTRLGYRVLKAANGVKALEVWQRHRNEIKLLLTDIVMPGGINGRDLGERLLKENPKLKVIYASGYSAELAGKDFPLEAGVNFLTKPFKAQKLAQTIRKQLDAPSSAPVFKP